MIKSKSALSSETIAGIYENTNEEVQAIVVQGIILDIIDSTKNIVDSPDVFVTGGTYSSGAATFVNSTGGTFSVTGFYTGSTDVDNYLPLSGGTLTGNLFVPTLSATTFYSGSTNLNTILK